MTKTYTLYTASSWRPCFYWWYRYYLLIETLYGEIAILKLCTKLIELKINKNYICLVEQYKNISQEIFRYFSHQDSGLDWSQCQLFPPHRTDAVIIFLSIKTTNWITDCLAASQDVPGHRPTNDKVSNMGRWLFWLCNYYQNYIYCQIRVLYIGSNIHKFWLNCTSQQFSFTKKT